VVLIWAALYIDQTCQPISLFSDCNDCVIDGSGGVSSQPLGVISIPTFVADNINAVGLSGSGKDTWILVLPMQPCSSAITRLLLSMATVHDLKDKPSLYAALTFNAVLALWAIRGVCL
jgi:hypothetical protein